MPKVNNIFIVLPHQLFECIEQISEQSEIYLIEEFLFFRQYTFHKQKLVLHRASMKKYQAFLEKKGRIVKYIDSQANESDIHIFVEERIKDGALQISLFDPCDDWIEQRISQACEEKGVELNFVDSPMWLNSKAELECFFKPTKKKFFQTQFYIAERKRLQILVEKGDKPVGGKWSFDDENRKKYPKKKTPPVYPLPEQDEYYIEAMAYVENYFSNNPGKLLEKPIYPTDYLSAKKHLQLFFRERFNDFGAYEDAIVQNESFLNHSVLTPMLNIGLITPNEIIKEAIRYADENEVPINSLEGFVRQIVGWREFIRGVYIAKGRTERSTNFWNFERKIPDSFYNGSTGILPVDNSIKKLLKTGYNHHIERLMVLGNFMVLCEIDPDEVYKWFMEMYVDSYDWVMVPNVYGMSQFADGGLMSTKPYISGSNYLMKMSDYEKGDWQSTWDALFWRFIAVHREFFEKNPRLSMMVRNWDKMDTDKKKRYINTAESFLKTL